MFNPEKLLGGLLMGGSRRRSGLGNLISGGAALGLAGVAMEAMEHFLDKPKPPASGPPLPDPRLFKHQHLHNHPQLLEHRLHHRPPAQQQLHRRRYLNPLALIALMSQKSANRLFC
ncbi:MAG TPA: hypothetical protein DCY53_00135 [Desulfobacteraceae bacterium]|nr:hypothetical protein [Desulfobacteraceae bacterium]